MTRPLTPDRDRLRFRYELLHARGREAVWPDATGTIDSVVVAPYDFWPEALLVTRDREHLRIPPGRVEAIDQQGRLLFDGSSAPSTTAATPARRARAGCHPRRLEPESVDRARAATASGTRRPRTRPRRLQPARHGGSRPAR